MKRVKEATHRGLRDNPAVRYRWETTVGRWGWPTQVKKQPPIPPEEDNEPIFSFDNPAIHGGKHPEIIMRAMNLTLDDHFELPPNSCDIHKVIEHMHARLVGAFQEWMYADSTSYDLPTYKLALERIFYTDPSVASHQVIMKDMQSLPALFRELVAIEGAWPKKMWR